MRILALVTDAFGGRGGIAQHNRQLLRALCDLPGVDEIVAFPRVVLDSGEDIPACLNYRVESAGSKARYVARVARHGFIGRGSFELVLSGHLNLLPFAAALAARHGARLIQVVHGIEAWNRPRILGRVAMRRVDHLVAVSDFTRRRVLEWADVPEQRTTVIPNA